MLYISESEKQGFQIYSNSFYSLQTFCPHMDTIKASIISLSAILDRIRSHRISAACPGQHNFLFIILEYLQPRLIRVNEKCCRQHAQLIKYREQKWMRSLRHGSGKTTLHLVGKPRRRVSDVSSIITVIFQCMGVMVEK